MGGERGCLALEKLPLGGAGKPVREAAVGVLGRVWVKVRAVAVRSPQELQTGPVRRVGKRRGAWLERLVKGGASFTEGDSLGVGGSGTVSPAVTSGWV